MNVNKNCFFVVLFALSCLPGCIPAVFVAGAAAGVGAGTAALNEHRSARTVFDDGEIGNAVQSRINSDIELQGRTHISVAVYDYQVLLVGQALHEDLRDRAVSSANSVPKVKAVRNEITIDKPILTSTRANDSWLTTKVKSVLLAEKELHSSQMKVITEDGTVYMMGLVSREHGNLAAMKASEIEGVRKVVKLFEYVQ